MARRRDLFADDAPRVEKIRRRQVWSWESRQKQAATQKRRKKTKRYPKKS